MTIVLVATAATSLFVMLALMADGMRSGAPKSVPRRRPGRAIGFEVEQA